MSVVSLDAIVNAVTANMPDATLVEQGEAIAAVVKRIDTDTAPAKPVARTSDPAAGSGSATMAPNWDGRMMKSAPGTATPNQQTWHIEHGLKPASARKLSMVAASNRRAKLEGKIAA